jgi:hypothetical protein
MPPQESIEDIPAPEQPPEPVEHPVEAKPSPEDAPEAPQETPVPEDTPLTLPDLPQEAIDDSVGATMDPEPVPTPIAVEPTPAPVSAFTQPLDAPVEELPPVETTTPELPALDEYADEKAEYLPEQSRPEVDHYVDAHDFYHALLDVKAIKKGLREQDADMRSWEELDERLEKKEKNTLDNIDQLQESLIKIDTALFEGRE